MRGKERRANVRIVDFLAGLRKTAEQLVRFERWYLILREVLRYFLKRRKLPPPIRPKLAETPPVG
jgi:hypothetical protein